MKKIISLFMIITILTSFCAIPVFATADTINVTVSFDKDILTVGETAVMTITCKANEALKIGAAMGSVSLTNLEIVGNNASASADAQYIDGQLMFYNGTGLETVVFILDVKATAAGTASFNLGEDFIFQDNTASVNISQFNHSGNTITAVAAEKSSVSITSINNTDEVEGKYNVGILTSVKAVNETVNKIVLTGDNSVDVTFGTGVTSGTANVAINILNVPVDKYEALKTNLKVSLPASN